MEDEGITVEQARAAEGQTPDEAMEALARLLGSAPKVKVGLRTVAVPCSNLDCERCADLRPPTAPSPQGLRIRLMPLPPLDLSSPFTPFALVVDGYPDDETAAKYRGYWVQEGEKIGAARTWCLAGRVELWDWAGQQYGA